MRKNDFSFFVVREKKYGLGQGLPARPWPGPKASRPGPGPVKDQVLPTPGGRDSGRLGLSVRTWLAEAATAADFKGGSRGAKPPQGKKFKLFLGCLNLGEYLASQEEHWGKGLGSAVHSM